MKGLGSNTPHNIWSAANGGVTNAGLRGVWPPVLEIGRDQPFSPFFCLFRPFPEGPDSTWKIQKTEEKGLFPQISSDLLKPPSLKPSFAALQNMRHHSGGIANLLQNCGKAPQGPARTWNRGLQEGPRLGSMLALSNCGRLVKLPVPRIKDISWDAILLLTVGSFLLTSELLCLQLCSLILP